MSTSVRHIGALRPNGFKSATVHSQMPPFSTHRALQDQNKSPRLVSWLRDSIRNRFFVLDAIERAFLITMFGGFLVRLIFVREVTPNVATLLLIVSEALPLVLVATRSWSKTISDKPLDWALALIGTTAPFLVVPGVPGSVIPQVVCVLIMLSGLCLQVSAKIILWRSFGIVAANRGVKIAGPYRLVRHPMYVGYTINHIGFLLSVPSLWNVVLYSATLAIQIARLLREERVLKHDPSYQEYSARVRYRLCPGVF